MKNTIPFLTLCMVVYSFLLAPAAWAQDTVSAVMGPQAAFDRTIDKESGPIPGDLVIPYPKIPESERIQRPLYDCGPLMLSSMDGTVLELIQEIDESLLLGYLEDLVDFGPRVTGSNACSKAGDYIYDTFQSMGLDVRYHEWSYYGYNGNNIEATIHDSSGTSNQILIICAHYDSVPGSPGADDNGSGTAAVLAIADILSKYTFDINIRFVTFDGEEQGLLGSHVYALEAKNNADRIIAVLNADMIGYAITQSHEKKIKVYHDNQSNWLVNFTDDVAEQYLAHIDLDVIPSGYSWGSDHSSFWDQGYSAVFYHEYKFNDYYHSSQDIIANMNIPYLEKCTKLVMATLGELAGPYDSQALWCDDHTLSAQNGGAINFSLDGGAMNGNRNYLLLASVTGTEPGTLLPGGLATLPLNWDFLTGFVLHNANTPALADFSGTLDSSGLASAQLNTYPLPMGTVGLELYFAYACSNPWDYVSNPLTVLIVD